MNIFKNILVIQKTSKINYLIEKYGVNVVKTSTEFDILNESTEAHSNNCDKFLKNLKEVKSSSVNVDVVTDNFLDNSILNDKLSGEKYDLIFSLGGDGTFLRSAHFINSGKPMLIGINTDKKYSLGFYCPLHVEECIENKQERLVKILCNKFERRKLNKIEVGLRDKKYYFMNDLYFGESFLGRISKYTLGINNENKIIKSSGVIFSTYSGYSGWIKNANTVSFPKFTNLIGKIAQSMQRGDVEVNQIVKMYNDKLFIPDYKDENSIFYFIREPSLRTYKGDENDKVKIEEYADYLNFMEGTANKISLESHCYEGVLILDGSFTIPVDYNDKIKIEVGDKEITTIKKLL